MDDLDHSRLLPGSRAHSVVWGLKHPSELAYAFGQRPECRRVVQGQWA